MQTAPFHILGFRTNYVTRNGQVQEVDYVDVCAPGMAQRTVTPLRIGDVMRVREDGDPDNPAWAMAKMKRDYIKPAYEAWKAGQALPEVGTPIGAWSGLTPEQAQGFRNVGLRSVEEIANATEVVITRVPLPNVRALQKMARDWLDGRESSKVAADLEHKDRQIAEMREQLEEMRQMLIENSQAEAKRRPRAKADEAVAA